MGKMILPYGKEKIEVQIEDVHLAGVLRSGIHGYRPAKSAVELVRESIEHPIGAPRLRELAAGKRKITVIASDHTRPVPSRITIPLLLDEIRTGQPDAEITILIATGMHRPTTREELIAARLNPEAIRQFIGADSLHYLPEKALSEAARTAGLCTACFSGRYPTELYGHRWTEE